MSTSHKQFRILIIGDTKAGKSTLLKKWCETDAEPIVRNQHGELVRSFPQYASCKLSHRSTGYIARRFARGMGHSASMDVKFTNGNEAREAYYLRRVHLREAAGGMFS